ncbi:MAG: DUF3618 domain-containing protein [Rubrobacteraceae bacterium]
MDDRPDQIRRQPSEPGVREKLSRERGEVDPNPAGTDDELETLRLELARTRAQMSETVYAIQGRMNPQYVREQASSQAKDTAREAGSSVVDTIKNNPIPAALTGAGVVGLGWLIASASGDSGSSGGGYGSSYESSYSGGRRPVDPGRRDLDDGPYYYGSPERSNPTYYEDEYEGSSESSQGSGRAQEAAGQARQRASQMGGQLQDRAGQAGQQAQQQAQRAKGGFQQALRDSPLALGALALGVGAAVGFAVPSTSKENEAMGETRDNLVERGKQSARETRERAQRVLEEGRRSAEQEAQRQDLTSE